MNKLRHVYIFYQHHLKFNNKTILMNFYTIYNI